MADVSHTSQSTPDLDGLLDILQPSAVTSMKGGIFVTSEPEVTYDWVNLGIFNQNLLEASHQDRLVEATFLLIEHCIEGYGLDRNRLRLINLCSERSGIARELTTLHGLKDSTQAHAHGIPICNVIIERMISSIHVELESCSDVSDRFKRREAILFVPVDSYVSEIEAVLNFLKEANNTVACIISLFSIAKTWDYRPAPDPFDILFFYRVEEKVIQRLTRMDDFLRLKPLDI